METFWQSDQQRQQSCMMIEEQASSLRDHHPWYHYEIQHPISINAGFQSHHQYYQQPQQQQLDYQFHDHFVVTQSSAVPLDNVSCARHVPDQVFFQHGGPAAVPV